MLGNDIQKLGGRAFCGEITAADCRAIDGAVIMGWDTEYDSKTSELITCQFWRPECNQLFEIPEGAQLTPGRMRDMLVEMLGAIPDGLVLVTFYSAAELQHIDTIHDATDHREYSMGFMDCRLTLPEGTDARPLVYDLARWYPKQSLAKVAAVYGFQKLEFDRTTVSRASIDQPGFAEYAMRDAELCYQIFSRLRADFKTVGPDILKDRTPASAAAAVFKSRIGDTIKTAATSPRKQALRSYWGGRAEVFMRGRFDRLAEYDLTSAYPSAAISIGKFPARSNWRPVMRSSEIMSGDYIGGVCTVDFKFSQGDLYPCLPVVAYDDALIYPLQGRSHCTFDEARQAFAQGADLAVVDAYGYKDGTPVLADFMTWATEARRLAGPSPVGVMYKLIANSLIGKMCQRVDRIALKDIYRAADAHAIPIELALCYDADHLAALDVIPKISIGQIWAPEWATLIMGRVRAELAMMIRQGGAYYVHTDSIWCKPAAIATRWIKFELKGEGPAVIARARLAAMWGADGTPLHVAHHSIWASKFAEALLWYWDGVTPLKVPYEVNKPLRVRPAAKAGENPGTWRPIRLNASLGWDHKRQLFPDGSTTPWIDADAYRGAIQQEQTKISR